MCNLIGVAIIGFIVIILLFCCAIFDNHPHGPWDW